MSQNTQTSQHGDAKSRNSRRDSRRDLRREVSIGCSRDISQECKLDSCQDVSRNCGIDEYIPDMSQHDRPRKKNKRTLKKKIRRIISIVMLFMFILLAMVQSFIAYSGLIMVSEFMSHLVGHSVTSVIHGEELRHITSENIVGTPFYDRLVGQLRITLRDLWDTNYVHFVVVKENQGLLMSVIDNQNPPFQMYPIPQKNIELLMREGSERGVTTRRGPFHFIHYAPIKDIRGNMSGIFVTEFNPRVLQIIFFVLVSMICILTFVGYLFSLVVTRVMTINITKPLDALAERIRMIARREGDLSQRVIFTKSYKEVEELAEATNMVMASTGNFVQLLEDKQHGLEEKNRELAAQAEELEAQTEELIALNESLEDAMRKLQDAQVQLVQSEKMASLGQLTAGIAHEINTPLGAINSNINIIEMVIEFLKADIDMENNDKAKSLVERVEKANDTNKLACDRIMQIVRHLKNFARLDESDFKEACIHEGIDSVLILSHNLLKHKIQVHKEYGEIPLVKCFPNLLNQIFMNLIVNSAQAIADKGDIWIKTWSTGKKVFVEVRDNGNGIPKENLRKIFDPGFTTKGVGIGTGLGLSICYKIVEKHNGSINVQSKVGEGTSFVIELPVNNTFKQVQEKELD